MVDLFNFNLKVVTGIWSTAFILKGCFNAIFRLGLCILSSDPFIELFWRNRSLHLFFKWLYAPECQIANNNIGMDHQIMINLHKNSVIGIYLTLYSTDTHFDVSTTDNF